GRNRHAQSPVAASSTSRQLPPSVSNRLFSHTVIGAPAASRSRSAGQSRQKSGLTQGFVARRRLFARRNWLMGEGGTLGGLIAPACADRRDETCRRVQFRSTPR